MSIDLLMNPSEPGDDAHEDCRDVAISLRERAEAAERELEDRTTTEQRLRDELSDLRARQDALVEERVGAIGASVTASEWRAMWTLLEAHGFKKRDRTLRFSEALQEVLEEREMDMHSRIRAGYDKTVADCWRAKVAELEARIEKAEKERDEALSSAENKNPIWERLDRLAEKIAGTHDSMEQANADALARLARYEAPGPALREAGPGERWHNVVNRAYREQHARDVAVVDRMLAGLHLTGRHDENDAAMLREVLTALTGEAEKAT